MDPSKFSVRVTKPTMVRHEKFEKTSNSEIPEKTSDYRCFNPRENFATDSFSWCAPRKVRTTDSSASFDDDSSEKELRIKNPTSRSKTVRRWSRASQEKRIEELSRPKVVVRRAPRTHEIRSKIHPNLENDTKKIKNSPSDVALKSCSVIEKAFRNRRTKDRIDQLAEPKVHRPIAINLLGKVEERALYAVASKRIAELATPKVLSTSRSNPNEKSDPYGVKPQALKATCSPRIEVLSRPRKLDFSSSYANAIVASDYARISG